MVDFTPNTYFNLLSILLKSGYSFNSFQDFITQSLNPKSSTSDNFHQIILRHDVDLRPSFSLKTAQIENSIGIKGSYYFRIVPESLDPLILCLIANLGHEIGYHYEDLTLENGNLEKAYQSFEKNLTKIRKFYPVTTACMHGSPRSPWDSKDLWKKYNYKDLGIIGEPYFDIDFDEWFYLTDTGRRWDGWKTSVRDKMPQQDKWVEQGLTYHSTQDIIMAAESGKLPKKIMITIHPQRWTDKPVPWLKEYILQSSKNVVKRWFFVGRKTTKTTY